MKVDRYYLEINSIKSLNKVNTPNEKLIFDAELITKSEATYCLEFKCCITSSKKTIARGSAIAIWRP